MEREILRRWVPALIDEIRPRSLVELGAGSAEKTRIILDGMRAAGTAEVYVPVDISADFLERTAVGIRRAYPGLIVTPVVADLRNAFDLPGDLPRPVLLTFLGSTIGNFAREEAIALLRRIRAETGPGDRVLLGVDLRKDPAVLEAAYNDTRGVTAAFNLNILNVVNRTVGTDFDPAAFDHRATYNTRENRIEMVLVSTRSQKIHLPGARAIEIGEGEAILTEISCKYDQPSIESMFAQAGLKLVRWQTDPDNLFAIAIASR